MAVSRPITQQPLRHPRQRLCSLRLLLSILLLPFVHASQAADTPDIGSRRELFVDRFLVSDLKNTTLKLHEPQWMPPVAPPRPNGHYATVLKADDKFQFYYRGDTIPGNTWKKGLEQYHAGEVTLYAESRDAIHWTLPSLGLFAHDTFPQGNIVLMNEFLVNHNFTPFIDTKPGVPPAEKYKALGGISYQPHQLAVRENAAPAASKPSPHPTASIGKNCATNPLFPRNGASTSTRRTTRSGASPSRLTSVTSAVSSRAAEASRAPPPPTSFTGPLSSRSM